MGAVDVLNVTNVMNEQSTVSSPAAGEGYRNRALATAYVSARASDLTAEDRAAWRVWTVTCDCDSACLWPVLSDTAPVRAIARRKQRTNKRRGDDERKR